MVEEDKEEKEEKKEKTAYVIPADSIEALRDEKPELFKEAVLAIHDYSVSGEIDLDNLSDGARMLFKSFRKGIDFYANKYAAKVKRNRETAKKRKPRKAATND